VTIPLTTNNDNKGTSSVLLTKLLLQNEVLDAKRLQDDSSPQFQALCWLANNDPVVLTSTAILVKQYVLAS
jgi:hypothetical protein